MTLNLTSKNMAVTGLSQNVVMTATILRRESARGFNSINNTANKEKVYL